MPVCEAIERETIPVALARWLSHRDPDTFPYEAVLARFRAVGKHFVDAELLDTLADVRAMLKWIPRTTETAVVLERFLDATLDKRDGRYDYPTYLALDVLQLPTGIDVAAAQEYRDRLVVQLVADVMRFELETSGGRTELLPQMRPEERTTTKRYRLGLAAIEPALRRLGLGAGWDRLAPVAAAERVCAEVEADTTPEERLRLRLSMLPVFVVHDEWMFLRVLQSFETTFALLAVCLRAAVAALGAGDAEAAERSVCQAESVFDEAAPLFSLLGTMQVEAFRTFRNYTEGASAIQSRNYKIVESLCRVPDRSRLDSIAYQSVPEARERVLAGQPTLDDAYQAARAAHGPSRVLDRVAAAMERFASTLLHWRQTHYRLAVRMLGERTGTGYTEGTPYLSAARTIPVFRSVSTDREEASS